ncbi:GDSL-type esterase/lipase family protein [Brevundimonas kwangchunensis]
MSDAVEPVGMVDSLSGQGGRPDDEAVAFARAYMAEGEMDPVIIAKIRDPERMAQREAQKLALKARDWPAFSHYRDANAARAGQRTDVVFIGDSITEMWRIAQPDLFEGVVVNRGISGQTSPQILLRFMPDVIALKPKVVHLMCGVNDIAGNTGPTTPGDYRNNILAMLDLATAHGIEVVLARLTPINGLPWSPGVVDPQARIVELNGWLASVAAERGLVEVDYGPALSDGQGGMDMAYTRDGLHPGAQGYAVMRPLAEAAIAKALAHVA